MRVLSYMLISILSMDHYNYYFFKKEKCIWYNGGRRRQHYSAVDFCLWVLLEQPFMASCWSISTKAVDKPH